MFRPETDGIDHVNIYSRGLTKEGRLLTNFSESPFKHPKYGSFNSVEGFWYWLRTGKQYNVLREHHGFKAKRLGMEFSFNIESKELTEEDIEDIKIAIKCKLKQNKHILQALVDTKKLPLTHYYFEYREIDLKKAKVKYLPKHQWQMDFLMELREKTLEWMVKKNINKIK